jgi:hypothetical protein
MNEGAIAVSGLPARENRMMNRSVANRSSGFHTRDVRNRGRGKTKLPVAGMITDMFTVSMTIKVEITDIKYPGIKIARLLPSHISLGVSVVAISEAIFPLTFSLTTGRPENAHIKAMIIVRGRK